MQKNRFTRYLTMLVLVFAMVISTAVPAFAKDEDYSFSIKGDQSRAFHICPDNSNQKEYESHAGTVNVISINVPPQTNWAFKLYYKGYSYDSDCRPDKSGNYYTDATNAVWAGGAQELHPTFLTGKAHEGWYYYVGGRLDDTVNDNKLYDASGTFNSDCTHNYFR